MKTNKNSFNHIGLDNKKCKALSGKLNHLLANYQVLYMNTRGLHWNVKGEQFISLHKSFDEFAEALTGYIDEIAERAVQLGGIAKGTNRMSAANSRLQEYPTETMGSMGHVEAHIERYAMVAASTRAAIATAETAAKYNLPILARVEFGQPSPQAVAVPLDVPGRTG